MEEKDFTPEIFTLTDEEGNEQEFELVDIMEADGTVYYALIPYHEEIEEDTELVVLKVCDDGEGEYLATIDNDEEYERIGQIFIERITEMFDGEDEEETEE